MANIKSAKKRIVTSQKRAAKNKAVKSGVKTAVKKVRQGRFQGRSAQEHCCPQGIQTGCCC